MRQNERLEFLGDAVLGIVITEALFTRNPDLPEGRLSEDARCDGQRQGVGRGSPGGSSWAPICAWAKARMPPGGRDKTSILSDSLEAVFGAIFLAQGLGTATEVIHQPHGSAAVRDTGASTRSWTGSQ